MPPASELVTPERAVPRRSSLPLQAESLATIGITLAPGSNLALNQHRAGIPARIQQRVAVYAINTRFHAAIGILGASSHASTLACQGSKNQGLNAVCRVGTLYGRRAVGTAKAQCLVRTVLANLIKAAVVVQLAQPVRIETATSGSNHLASSAGALGLVQARFSNRRTHFRGSAYQNLGKCGCVPLRDTGPWQITCNLTVCADDTGLQTDRFASEKNACSAAGARTSLHDNKVQYPPGNVARHPASPAHSEAERHPSPVAPGTSTSWQMLCMAPDASGISLHAKPSLTRQSASEAQDWMHTGCFSETPMHKDPSGHRTPVVPSPQSLIVQ